eukprot:14562364-Alexandrium_andersonii.AAC.1
MASRLPWRASRQRAPPMPSRAGSPLAARSHRPMLREVPIRWSSTHTCGPRSAWALWTSASATKGWWQGTEWGSGRT